MSDLGIGYGGLVHTVSPLPTMAERFGIPGLEGRALLDRRCLEEVTAENIGALGVMATTQRDTPSWLAIVPDKPFNPGTDQQSASSHAAWIRIKPDVYKVRSDQPLIMAPWLNLIRQQRSERYCGVAPTNGEIIPIDEPYPFAAYLTAHNALRFLCSRRSSHDLEEADFAESVVDDYKRWRLEKDIVSLAPFHSSDAGNRNRSTPMQLDRNFLSSSLVLP